MNTGSIYKTKNNSFRARIMIDRKVVAKIFKSRGEAEIFLLELLIQHHGEQLLKANKKLKEFRGRDDIKERG